MSRRSAIRAPAACPYLDCRAPSPAAATGGKNRSPAHTLAQCAVCEGYSVLAQNGHFYPFVDPTDIDDDPVISIP